MGVDKREEWCCELANVVSAILALVVAIAASFINSQGWSGAGDCAFAIGEGANFLASVVRILPLNYTLLLLMNIVSVGAVWFSFFHCDKLDGKVLHCLTSPRSLCALQIVVSGSFLLQLVVLPFLLTLSGWASLLSYMCNLGQLVVTQAQELVWAMGNDTSPSASSVQAFNPYGDKPVVNRSLPLVGIQDVVEHLQIQRFCDTAPAGDSSVLYVCCACLLVAASQALMASALNAEKERALVHETHDLLFAMSGEGTEEKLHLMAGQAGDTAKHLISKNISPQAADVASQLAAKGSPVAAQLAGQLGSYGKDGVDRLTAAASPMAKDLGHLGQDNMEKMAGHAFMQAMAKR